MGNVYVTDTTNHRIQLFLTGQLTGTTIIGTTGVRGNEDIIIEFKSIYTTK
jgi:hypothetical protein